MFVRRHPSSHPSQATGTGRVLAVPAEAPSTIYTHAASALCCALFFVAERRPACRYTHFKHTASTLPCWTKKIAQKSPHAARGGMHLLARYTTRHQSFGCRHTYTYSTHAHMQRAMHALHVCVWGGSKCGWGGSTYHIPGRAPKKRAKCSRLLLSTTDTARELHAVH